MKKLKIDLSELEMGFDNDAMSPLNYFLDTETGEVVMVDEESRSAVNKFFDLPEDEAPDFEQWLDGQSYQDWQCELIEVAYKVEMADDDRYLLVPSQNSREGFNNMADFVETVTDARLRELLIAALNRKGPFRGFKDVLFDYPEERERWFAFSRECLMARMIEWLESEDIEVEDVNPYRT